MSQDRKIKRGNSKCTRRQFELALGTISLTLTTTAGKMMAGNSLQSTELTLEENLQVALREIGSDVTKTAADVKLIANALDRTPVSELARLVSFSFSYNAIGDDDASTVAASLPASLTELGLVGCSIGDQGGGAILEWAKYANGLRMICIEDNSMSDQMRKQFGSLRGMSVFV